MQYNRNKCKKDLKRKKEQWLCTVREHHGHTEDVAAHILRKVYTKAVIHSISYSSFFKSHLSVCLIKPASLTKSGAFFEPLVHVWLSAQVSNVIIYGRRDTGQNCSTRASS